MEKSLVAIWAVLKELEKSGDVEIFEMLGKTYVNINDGYMVDRELVNENLVNYLFEIVEPYKVKKLWGGGEYKIGNVMLKLEYESANE